MKKNATKFILGLLSILIIAAGYWAIKEFNFTKAPTLQNTSKNLAEKTAGNIPELEKKLSKVEAKRARNEYFFRLLRDPATNSIPENVRARELQHARQMPTMQQLRRQQSGVNNGTATTTDGFEWRLAGPPAVGGRTRALGIDQRNPDIILAGGVSGGMWRSTDGGDTWTLRTPDFDSFSVTSLAQDPTNPDTWYYTAGELRGNSASGRNRTATYFGTGIFVSTDNGLTWTRIPGTEDDDAAFSSQFDFTPRIIVSPTTGTIFYASNGVGIYRVTNGNFNNGLGDFALGGVNEHVWADVAVAPDGTLAAVLSSVGLGNTTSGDPGIFISNDDGQTWTEITPTSFPSAHFRSVITFAPSDPNTAYVFTQKDTEVDSTNQGVSLFRLDLSGNPENAEDRAANLPDFGPPVGRTETQFNYNMDVAVKPDDPDFVLVANWNLWRSTDGFATGPTGDDQNQDQRNQFWVGGYGNDSNQQNGITDYPNQHPDQHILTFDPTDPNRLWAGHDGGLSVTNNVEADFVNWIDRNDGYIVTQFYDATIGPEGDDNRFLGGTQDNGTPFFEFQDDQDIGNVSTDISSGDGGFSFLTDNLIYVSNQQGGSGNNRVIRLNSDGSNFAIVQPQQAQTAFFINPYTVDPNDETIMYYPGGSELFRNISVDEITNQTNNGGTTQGWQELEAAATPGFNISALSVSTIPTNILYFAGSNFDDPPIIRRLDNADTSNDAPAEIDIPGVAAGAFVHDFAINPINGSEVLVVMANYNITGLYHTTDGGNSWTAVEGNLTGGDLQGDLTFGPSIRSATIVPAESGPIYVLGTSTGVYATQNLDGENTQWGRESPFDSDGLADIGFSVIENITSRFSDGDIAAGSHGRGMFVGRFQGEIADANIPQIMLDPTEAQAGDEITITAINFEFSSDISVDDVLFGDVPAANITNITPSQITVVVPRNTLDPTSEDRTLLVAVDRESGADPAPTSLTILPPGENELSQNFPNPFSTGEGTAIPISLRNNSSVTLQIYDTTGRLVDEPLSDDTFQAGTFDIPVNNFSNFASGVYIYRIIAEPTNGNSDTFVDSEKFTFIR